MTHAPTESLPTVFVAQSASGSILVWIVALIAIVIVGGIAVMVLRKRLLEDRSPSADVGGLMDQLRAMRDRGELSEEEFARARRSLVDKQIESMSRPEGGDDASGNHGQGPSGPLDPRS